MILENLPFPPSVNSYYRSVVIGGFPRVLISKDGRKYKQRIVDMLPMEQTLGQDLMMLVDLYPPNKRRIDIDNRLKALLDSLEAARVYADDSQIKDLHVIMHDPVKGGRVDVEIKPLEK